MEIHYDNPSDPIGFIDKVNVNFYTTAHLRKHELGIFQTGFFSNRDVSLPPQAQNIEISSYCYDSCMDSVSITVFILCRLFNHVLTLYKKLEDTNMTVLFAFPHTHLTGVEVSTSIIRNGVDIGYLYRNKYYDFNYQNYYPLDPPVVLQKVKIILFNMIFTILSYNNFDFLRVIS